MSPAQRKNLLTLATYLESLPENYTHFDMDSYAEHNGDCKLPMSVDKFAAQKPQEFLANCGTVACAVGHGPAAGILLQPKELKSHWGGVVRWYDYAERAFDAGAMIGATQLFDFLFGGEWSSVDNHHYGAAARIRYYLDTGRAFSSYDKSPRAYAPYRKGSSSARRREIDASCDTHPKDGDAKQAPLGSGAVGEAETPNA